MQPDSMMSDKRRLEAVSPGSTKQNVDCISSSTSCLWVTCPAANIIVMDFARIPNTEAAGASACLALGRAMDGNICSAEGLHFPDDPASHTLAVRVSTLSQEMD